MKQKILALSLCMALLILANSSYSQKDILVGVKGGIGIPDLTSGSNSNPVSSGWSSRLGPYFGAVASIKIKSILSIQVELNYSSQGGKKNGGQGIPSSYFPVTLPPNFPPVVYANLNNETRLNYVEVPVLAKITLPLGHGLHFFVDAGPYAGLMVAAKNIANGHTQFYYDAAQTQPVSPQSFDIDVNEDVRSDIKHFNFGIQGGIGLQQKLLIGYLTLTVGGNYGFIPIQRDASNGQNNTGAATATIGYLVKI